jgi:PII-like signaling protein
MTELGTEALRLMVFVGEDDTWHHRPVYSELVIRARQAGMAGATVLRGLESFGRRSVVHTSRLVSLSSDLPVVVIIVDDGSKIRPFLEDVRELVGNGLVTLEEVEVIRYAGSPGDRYENPGPQET